MWYVWMVDRFCSNWKSTPTENKQNVLIFECESLQEALIIVDNGENRSDMINIDYDFKYPVFNDSVYFVEEVCRDKFSAFYIPKYFERMNGNE